jgi:hypothetical protein
VDCLRNKVNSLKIKRELTSYKRLRALEYELAILLIVDFLCLSRMCDVNKLVLLMRGNCTKLYLSSDKYWGIDRSTQE